MNTNQTESDAIFCVSIVGFSDANKVLFKEILRELLDSAFHTTRCLKRVVDAAFHPACVHAIVFTPSSLADVGEADVEAVRSAANMGTCRIYLAVGSDEKSLSNNSLMDDFIQRSPSYDYDRIVKEIDTFFHEADRLNRESTPMAIRDKACLMIHGILSHLWPVSYMVAALLVLDAAWVVVGRPSWLVRYLSPWVLFPMTFYAFFFVVHCIRVIIRNWLLAIRIARRVDLPLIIGSLVLCSAATATVYAIVMIEPAMTWSVSCLLLAILLLAVYTFCRRIRFECTSISGLQESLANPDRREEVINGISKTRLGQNSFPLFPFRGKKLFISYMHLTPSHWSSESAEKVSEWAEAQGFEVFLDRSAIQSGTLWRNSLLRAVSECNVFVALLDGDVPVTHWVLAESAYASLLRKSIGKPLTLLVIKNPDQIVQNGANPFRRVYADVFECPPGQSFGASVLPVDEARPLTDKRFLQAIDAVRPMSLLFVGKGARAQSGMDATAEAGNAPKLHLDEFQLADRSWKTAVLLVSLAQTGNNGRSQVRLLESRCKSWIESNSTMKRAVALNTLRFLAKGGLLTCLEDIQKSAVYTFLSETSLAARLAALDFLSATAYPENPLSKITEYEKRQIREFQSKLISTMQSAQKAFAEHGVHTELHRLTSGQSAEAALQGLIDKMELLP